MKKIIALYCRGVEALEKCAWLPPLLARISLGSIFISTGWGKLHNLPKVVSFFTDLGIPFPEFNAGLVGTSEFSCGLLIFLGLLTRLAPIPLIVTMTVALLTAKKADINGLTDLFGQEEYIYIVIFIWLVISGGGRISLDHLLHRRCGVKPESLRSKD